MTISAARVFADLRAGMMLKPAADRVTVTVRHEGRSPAVAMLTVRTAPGVRPDGRDCAVLIEAGDLRAWTDGSVLLCVLASNPATYVQAEIDQPPDVSQLRRVVPPLPLPHLPILWNSSADTPTEVLPMVGPISWKPTLIRVDPRTEQEPLVLSGAVAMSAVGVVLTTGREEPQAGGDLQRGSRLRLRALTAPLPGEADPGAPTGTVPAVRSIAISMVPIDPGEPTSWKPDLRARTRVGAIKDLVAKPAVTPNAVPAESSANPAAGTPSASPPNLPSPEPLPQRTEPSTGPENQPEPRLLDHAIAATAAR